MEMIAMLGGLGSSFSPPNMPVYGRRAMGCLGCNSPGMAMAGLGDTAPSVTIAPTESAGTAPNVTVTVTPPETSSGFPWTLIGLGIAAVLFTKYTRNDHLSGYEMVRPARRKQSKRRSY